MRTKVIANLDSCMSDDQGNLFVTFKTDNLSYKTWLQSLEKRLYSLIIDEPKRDRSLDQNALLWALIEEICQHENAQTDDKWEMYCHLLKLSKAKYTYISILNDCIAYNISSMKWTTLDYVESYAKIGYEDYQIILKLKDEFPWVTITTLISLAKCVGYTVNTSTEVQSGKFKLHCNVNSLINKLNLIEDVSQSIGRVAGYKVILYVVIGNLMDLNIIDEDRLKEQLIKYGSTIQTVTNTNDALEKIEEVYNYKKKQKVRFVSAYQERFED